MKVRPIFDRLVVRKVKPQEKIGSIIIPQGARLESQQAVVVAVGTGRNIDAPGGYRLKLIQPLTSPEFVSDGDGSLEQLGALVDVLGNVALEVRRPTMTVKPGDRILMGKFTGSDIQIRSKKDDIPEELTILREDEVLAVLEAEEGDELDETVENPQAVAAAAGREVVDAEAPNEEDLDEQDLAALEDALGLPQEVVGPPPDEPEPEEETPARPKIEDGE